MPGLALLVPVHVRVDDAGHDVLAGGVDHRVRARAMARLAGADRRDDAVLDDDVDRAEGRPRAAVDHHRVANQQPPRRIARGAATRRTAARRAPAAQPRRQRSAARNHQRRANANGHRGCSNGRPAIITDKVAGYVAAAAGVPASGVPRERRGAPDSDPRRVSRTACGASRIRRSRTPSCSSDRPASTAASAPSARCGRCGRAACSDADEHYEAELTKIAQGGRVGALLRGSARAGAAADDLEPDAAVGEPPLRGDLGRRPRHHGGREPRRARGRRQDHRPQHPPAVRAGREPVHHRGPALRVPLLLHAEVLVRVPRQGAGHLPRRLRHAATSSSRSSRSCRPTSCRRRSKSSSTAASTGTEVLNLKPMVGVGRDRRAGSRSAAATPTRRRTPSTCCAII